MYKECAKCQRKRVSCEKKYASNKDNKRKNGLFYLILMVSN